MSSEAPGLVETIAAGGEEAEGKHCNNGGGSRDGVPGGGLNSQADPPSVSDMGSVLKVGRVAV